MVKLLVISILTSAAASCQTTILPATRTMLSMGSHGAAPPKLAQIDHKRLTPDFSTWLFGIGSIVWYVLLVVISNNTDTDAYSASIAAVGMAIAVYYGLSGISCIVYYRRFLTKSVKNFFLIGVLPGFGGSVLLYVFAKTVWDSRNADYGYGTLFGVGTVLVIGTLLLVVGVPLMLWCSFKYPRFFTYRPDPADLVKDPNGTDTLAAPLGTYTRSDPTGARSRKGA
jgi:amino acid transporter